MVCDCASLRKKSTAVLWQNYDAGFGRILLCVAAGKRSGKQLIYRFFIHLLYNNFRLIFINLNQIINKFFSGFLQEIIF